MVARECFRNMSLEAMRFSLQFLSGVDTRASVHKSDFCCLIASEDHPRDDGLRRPLLLSGNGACRHAFSSFTRFLVTAENGSTIRRIMCFRNRFLEPLH